MTRLKQGTHAREYFGDPRMERLQGASKDLRRELGANPFLRGQLIADVPLLGIRGRVQSISGTTLTLCDPATTANFQTYQAGTRQLGATVVASATDGTSGTQRSGSVNISGTNAVTGTLESASGNWTTAISGLTAGDYLFGINEWGPPVPIYSGGQRTGRFSSGPVVSLRVSGFERGASGVLVLRSAIQPAQVWWLGQAPGVVNLGSRYAGRADLWIF